VLPPDLEHSLRDLPRIGTQVKDRGYREIWRFEHRGKAYFLKFYPKHGWRDYFRRLFRGSPALAEFARLQLLQKANIPAPRAVATLVNFRLADRVGDAVVLEAIEPSISLDAYLLQHQMNGTRAPDHLRLAREVRQLVQQLDQAGLGHDDLHLGNFLIAGGKLYLMDGYAVKAGGMRRDHLLLLGHSAAPFATTTDLLRGWYALGDGGPMPTTNRLSLRLWRGMIKRVKTDNRYFGRLVTDTWRGVFVKRSVPRPWSAASAMEFEQTDWARAWPTLLKRMEADEFQILKRSPSGDVLAGELVVGGRPIEIIVKRPRRRYWYRYLNEIGRGSRPRRAWVKAWRALHRGLPTAWPLLLMERRRFGYVVDAVVVFERVPGEVLSRADLNALDTDARDRLFRRAGRVLRRIESFGWSHFDAKNSNWIVQRDAPGGPYAIMVDIEGIRRRRWVALGIQRLLKSMLRHPQYTPADSLALCQGYAPRAPLALSPPDGDAADAIEPTRDAVADETAR
jgi:tRNA A-37 threonylcarbamoyl transferase component Bud32